MRTTKILLLAAAVLLAGTCFAQDYSVWDEGIDYSYAHWNPTPFPSGTLANGQHFATGHSLNGGGATMVYNITSWIGVKVDLQGYGSHLTSFAIPVGNQLLPKGGTLTSSGSLFTYVFGPEVKLRAGRWNPFFQTLVGGAYSNVYENLFRSAGTTGNPNSNAFTMVVGGGLDIPVNKTITIRAGEVDYLLTRFGAPPAFPRGSQNSLRIVAGFVFTFY